MEEVNKVSVWIGNSKSESDFEKYIEENYTDEGDMESSFMKDFQIEYYDVQFKECLFKNSNKEKALKDFSYSENFIAKINKESFTDKNSFIFLYNFNYDESVIERNNFKFIGKFDYR